MKNEIFLKDPEELHTTLHSLDFTTYRSYSVWWEAKLNLFNVKNFCEPRVRMTRTLELLLTMLVSSQAVWEPASFYSHNFCVAGSYPRPTGHITRPTGPTEAHYYSSPKPRNTTAPKGA